jgi:hypothetical protein
MPEEDPQPWQPLFVRDTPSSADYEGLVEGIPAHLENSLWRWAMDRAVRTPNLSYKAERLLRIALPVQRGTNPFGAYWSAAGEQERLTLIDFFLRDMWEAANELRAGREPNHELQPLVVAFVGLDEILTQGGSVWATTVEPCWGLTRRVNETTRALIDTASSPATDAARKIASAWAACYRHTPDYDVAYRDAVLAVEALSLPLIVPDNKRGTLGSVVGHLNDTHERWTVGGLDDERQGSGATLLSMLRTLWHNQERHAQSDGTIRDVGREEAEAAVVLAVTLVHWFSAGLVKRAN